MTIAEFILGTFLFFLLFFLFGYFKEFFIFLGRILGISRSQNFINWQYKRGLKRWR